MKKERLVWADSLKGWLMVLVVLGHAIQMTIGNACISNHLWNIIYSFHMPAFMAVSGYLAYRPNLNWGGQKFDLSTVVVRRFRQLIIPFFAWTLILMLNNGIFNLKAIGSYLLYPDKGLWFLWVLFFITVIFMTSCWLSDRIHIKQEIVISTICLFIAGAMVTFNIRILGYQFFAFYFLFYALGYFLNKHKDKIISNNAIVLCVLAVCWMFLAWFWQMHEVPVFLSGVSVPSTLMSYLYRFITATIAIYLLMAVSPHLLNVNKSWNTAFVKMGNLSLGIYVVHFIFLGRLVSLFKCTGFSVTMLIVLSFITGLLLSWFVVWLISRWQFGAKWLLGKL